MGGVDATHAAGLRSWVGSARGHADFPIQNLPFGVFNMGGDAPGCGVAIGDAIVDLRALHAAAILDDAAQAVCDLCLGDTLNAFLAAGAGARRALRRGLSAFLAEGSAARPDLIRAAADCTMHLPARIGDYTDFYAGIHHATNVGKLFRPDNPLLPNYKHLPIGYHGRASSVRASGASVIRPNGQTKDPAQPSPRFGPCERLDYELELGIWLGPGNAAGEPIPIGSAGDHIAGYCLLNDWSARDLQSWEYQPLGPFLAKSFLTTVSPWIVTPEALAPFRQAQAARPAGDPQPLAYLWDPADQQSGALGICLEVFLLTPLMRQSGLPAHRLSQGCTEDLYWTPAQLVAHHASNGCELRAGDLLGSGTISAADAKGWGSLLEITQGGGAPIGLPSGESRTFLEDGDDVIFIGRASAEGAASIGFGPCTGRLSATPK